MDTKNEINVSIIIPSYNRREDLLNCLKTVFSQNFKGFESIVVDDASTDGTRQALKEKGWLDKINYLRNQKRVGVSKTKNKGVKGARGKYCWFLDSDTEILSEGCLEFLYKTMEADSQIGSLGCEIIQRGKDRLIREHTFFGTDVTHPLKSERKVRMKNCDYSATCNCFVQTDLIKKIGGFNEEYFYGYEDAELGKKILKLGYQNMIDARAAVLHVRSTTARTANYKLFFKNRIRFALWNFSLPTVAKLPIIDIQNFVKGLTAAKGLKTKEIKGQAPSKINQILGKVGLLIECFYGLMYGYIWNIIFLPKTLLTNRNKNYLEDYLEDV